MEIEIRFHLNEGRLARVDLNFKGFKNGVNFSFVIEHPLLVILRHIVALKKQENDPTKIQQIEEYLENVKNHFRLLQKQQHENQIDSSEQTEVKSIADSTDLLLLQDQTREEILSNNPVSPSTFISLFKNAYNKELARLVDAVQQGLAAGIEPDLCEEGVNGTYFLKDKNGNRVAVFKPEDEEGNSATNPKNNSDSEEQYVQGKGGINEGEASQREVAAYLLDKHNFFGVPATQMVSISHPYFKNSPKIGSIQEFVTSDGCCEDVAVSTFPIKEVHKIGVLDVQLFNMDRHGGNILYRKSQDGQITLIPIDHGFSLPDSNGLGNAWFDWLNWPQAKQPFDEETKKYINNINLENDLVTLEQELGIRKECLTTMKISTTLLKKAVDQNLTLYDIGSIVCRKTFEEPSELEIMCQKARDQTTRDQTASFQSEDEEVYLERLFKIMDEELGN